MIDSMHHIRTLIGDHVPSDDLERHHQARMLDLLNTQNPFSRTQYEPGHFTASGFVLSPELDKVLLIFHKKLNRWLQPGGHIEPGDVGFRAAALREVVEETGFAMVPEKGGLLDLDVHLIPSWKEAPSHEHFDVRFWFVSTGVRADYGSDAHDLCWVGFEGMDGADESVARALRRLKGMVSPQP